MWIMWKINRKTNIPERFDESKDDSVEEDCRVMERMIELQEDREHIYAVRFNLKKIGD